jgi:hypothetical protein
VVAEPGPEPPPFTGGPSDVVNLGDLFAEPPPAAVVAEPGAAAPPSVSFPLSEPPEPPTVAWPPESFAESSAVLSPEEEPTGVEPPARESSESSGVDSPVAEPPLVASSVAEPAVEWARVDDVAEAMDDPYVRDEPAAEEAHRLPKT